jgi:hypothetical protein
LITAISAANKPYSGPFSVGLSVYCIPASFSFQHLVFSAAHCFQSSCTSLLFSKIPFFTMTSATQLVVEVPRSAAERSNTLRVSAAALVLKPL